VITVDANHPLADRRPTFDIQLVGIMAKARSPPKRLEVGPDRTSVSSDGRGSDCSMELELATTTDIVEES
jgi:hypothetical protein